MDYFEFGVLYMINEKGFRIIQLFKYYFFFEVMKDKLKRKYVC